MDDPSGSSSTVPLPAAFFHPILVVLSQHPNGLRRRDLHEPAADLLDLSPEQRLERLPSGAHLRYQHRLGWGLNMLKNAGYVASAAPLWRATPKGRDLLAANPSGFEDTLNRQIVQEARLGTGMDGGAQEVESSAAAAQQTPEERIDSAIAELHGALARELLERILQASPEFFEELVLDLLHAIGYGRTAEDLEHVGRSGDGGIDGVISLDKLGLEKVFVQAKRWQGSVGRPEVQAFYGALAGRRAKKGVLITTSTFTKDAKDYCGRLSESVVVLIDGSRLAALMIENGVGVTHQREIRLARLDGDYFVDA